LFYAPHVKYQAFLGDTLDGWPTTSASTAGHTARTMTTSIFQFTTSNLVGRQLIRHRYTSMGPAGASLSCSQGHERHTRIKRLLPQHVKFGNREISDKANPGSALPSDLPALDDPTHRLHDVPVW